MADQEGNLSWKDLFGIEKFSPSLKEALISQLEKDLQHTFANHQPAQLFEEIRNAVSNAIESNTLSALLYRVDLPEPKALKCMASADPIACLVKLILEREAQKVIFRWQYSQ